MLFIMHSKTLDKIYMEKESFTTVLKTNYAVVSTMIRKSATNARRYKNILLFSNHLYPSADVQTAIDNEEYIRNYKSFLKGPEQMQDLASIVRLSCTIKYPVVLLSTVTEYKECLYMKVLAAFIEQEFGCPVFNYKKHQSTKDLLDNKTKNKIVAKCNSVIKKTTKELHKKNLSSSTGIQRIENRAEFTSKKKLKKILKKHDLYEKGLCKEDMVERYTAWCMDEPI